MMTNIDKKRAELDYIFVLFEEFTDYFAGYEGVDALLEKKISQQISDLSNSLNLLEKELDNE